MKLEWNKGQRGKIQVEQIAGSAYFYFFAFIKILFVYTNTQPYTHVLIYECVFEVVEICVMMYVCLLKRSEAERAHIQAVITSIFLLVPAAFY